MVSRTANARRSIPDPEAITKYFALATCAWPRIVGDNAMILPTWSAARMDNTQNLWKHASNLRKRFTSCRRCLFPPQPNREFPNAYQGTFSRNREFYSLIAGVYAAPKHGIGSLGSKVRRLACSSG